MLRQTSIPIQSAVTLAAAKSHLRVDHDLEDETIARYLAAAIDAASIYTNRQINQAEWQMSFDAWPACGFFALPIAPIVSVDAVTYFDEDDVEQTVAADLWSFVYTGEGGRLYLLEDFTSPTLRTDGPPDRIYVALTAGYDADDGSSGDDPELVIPPAITAAILLMLAHLYANREDVVVGKGAVQIPRGAEYLLDRHKIYR
jgi:uncharacterized phiE125 gp8 family phage protein